MNKVFLVGAALGILSMVGDLYFAWRKMIKLSIPKLGYDVALILCCVLAYEPDWWRPVVFGGLMATVILVVVGERWAYTASGRD